MNKVILTGRLTADPNVRYSQGNPSICVARFRMAVDRRKSRNQQEGQPTADFFNIVAFGKYGEHVEKYYHKGMRVGVMGRLQNNQYEKDGIKVYSDEVIADDLEFEESKGASGGQQNGYVQQGQNMAGDGFMNVPDDTGVPFN